MGWLPDPYTEPKGIRIQTRGGHDWRHGFPQLQRGHWDPRWQGRDRRRARALGFLAAATIVRRRRVRDDSFRPSVSDGHDLKNTELSTRWQFSLKAVPQAHTRKML